MTEVQRECASFIRKVKDVLQGMRRLSSLYGQLNSALLSLSEDFESLYDEQDQEAIGPVVSSAIKTLRDAAGHRMGERCARAAEECDAWQKAAQQRLKRLTGIPEDEEEGLCLWEQRYDAVNTVAYWYVRSIISILPQTSPGCISLTRACKKVQRDSENFPSAQDGGESALKSLECLLSQRTAAQYLRMHMAESFTEETIDFCLESQNLNAAKEAGAEPSELYSMAIQIISTYVSENAPRPINISDTTKKALLEATEHPEAINVSTFMDVRSELLQLVACGGTFTSFKSSPYCTRLRRRLSPRSFSFGPVRSIAFPKRSAVIYNFVQSPALTSTESSLVPPPLDEMKDSPKPFRPRKDSGRGIKPISLASVGKKSFSFGKSTSTASRGFSLQNSSSEGPGKEGLTNSSGGPEPRYGSISSQTVASSHSSEPSFDEVMRNKKQYKHFKKFLKSRGAETALELRQSCINLRTISGIADVDVCWRECRSTYTKLIVGKDREPILGISPDSKKQMARVFENETMPDDMDVDSVLKLLEKASEEATTILKETEFPQFLRQSNMKKHKHEKYGTRGADRKKQGSLVFMSPSSRAAKDPERDDKDDGSVSDSEPGRKRTTSFDSDVELCSSQGTVKKKKHEGDDKNDSNGDDDEEKNELKMRRRSSDADVAFPRREAISEYPIKMPTARKNMLPFIPVPEQMGRVNAPETSSATPPSGSVSPLVREESDVLPHKHAKRHKRRPPTKTPPPTNTELKEAKKRLRRSKEGIHPSSGEEEEEEDVPPQRPLVPPPVIDEEPQMPPPEAPLDSPLEEPLELPPLLPPEPPKTIAESCEDLVGEFKTKVLGILKGISSSVKTVRTEQDLSMHKSEMKILLSILKEFEGVAFLPGVKQPEMSSVTEQFVNDPVLQKFMIRIHYCLWEITAKTASVVTSLTQISHAAKEQEEQLDKYKELFDKVIHCADEME